MNLLKVNQQLPQTSVMTCLSTAPHRTAQKIAYKFSLVFSFCFLLCASASAQVLDGWRAGTNKDGDVEIKNTNNKAIKVSTNGKKRFIIDSAGNVGIGNFTDSSYVPKHPLDVYGRVGLDSLGALPSGTGSFVSKQVSVIDTLVGANSTKTIYTDTMNMKSLHLDSLQARVGHNIYLNDTLKGSQAVKQIFIGDTLVINNAPKTFYIDTSNMKKMYTDSIYTRTANKILLWKDSLQLRGFGYKTLYTAPSDSFLSIDAVGRWYKSPPPNPPLVAYRISHAQLTALGVNWTNFLSYYHDLIYYKDPENFVYVEGFLKLPASPTAATNANIFSSSAYLSGYNVYAPLPGTTGGSSTVDVQGEISTAGIMSIANATLPYTSYSGIMYEAASSSNLWTPLTLAAGWTAGAVAPAYRLDSRGIVHFRGQVYGGADASVISTLPLAISSFSRRIFLVASGLASASAPGYTRVDVVQASVLTNPSTLVYNPSMLGVANSTPPTSTNPLYLENISYYPDLLTYGSGPYNYVATNTANASNPTLFANTTTARNFNGLANGLLFTSTHSVNGNYSSAAYYKDAYGLVHLSGYIQNDLVATAMFTLPPGYRPSGTIPFAVFINDLTQKGRIDIYSNGDVVVQIAALISPAVSLEGIVFPAEQ